MRTLSVAGAAAAALVASALTWSVVDAAAPSSPAPVSASTFYWGTGPSADYSGDAGSIGQVVARRFTVPAGDGVAAYDGVVTLGMQYRTRGEAPFVAGVLLGRVGTDRRLETRPGTLRLAATGRQPDSTTLTFRVTGLVPGATYEVAPTVNASFGGTNRIGSRSVVLDVSLTPR